MSFATLKPDPFFNRAHELAALDRAWKHRGNGGQMMLLYGRRRLGKTYLGSGKDSCKKPTLSRIRPRTGKKSLVLSL